MAEQGFHQLLQNPAKTDNQKRLMAAVTILSVKVFPTLTPEQVWGKLLPEYEDLFGSTGELHQIKRQLDRMEERQLAQSTTLSRLQADADAAKASLATIQSNQAALSQAQSDAVARLEADLAKLQAAAADDPALNAIADSIESSLTGFKGVSDSLAAAATAASGIDPAPPPVSTAPVVSPATAAVTPGGTQQFSSAPGVTWSAVSGTIDATGLYTGPADLTITSDVVTATGTDGQTGTASITIG